jgi:hypothetical protein
MKKILVFTTILALGVLFILPVSGCRAAPGTTATTTRPQLTTTLPPGQEPVEIVSVTGPLQPVNPGGPIVEITLKNTGAEPVISLSADLFILRAGPPGMPAFVFTFKVDSGNPLLPGNSTSFKQTLIGGGFSDTITYPLTINGTLQNGIVFSYTKQVLIVPPAK